MLVSRFFPVQIPTFRFSRDSSIYRDLLAIMMISLTTPAELRHKREIRPNTQANSFLLLTSAR